ncbi:MULTISPECIES: hypothetical protein [Gammaproteobacteria]|jgi:hypothetical protein|uniref:Uncharacterized protein n=1 Tax=Klebsiella quasipneumoniae subsp. quasipneumoniae TaxID=1667327 RepID=A0AAW8XZ66_9ENTR|nr:MULTISPECIES: hypothetical protein [Gammaproteobacteria]MDV0844954.1 hypothetical protein [Klebsiella quasipneumoniae subsp. quasipneumoniae]
MIKTIASIAVTYVGLVCSGVQMFGVQALGPITYTLLIIPAVIFGLIAKAIITSPES